MDKLLSIPNGISPPEVTLAKNHEEQRRGSNNDNFAKRSFLLLERRVLTDLSSQQMYLSDCGIQENN